MMPALAASLARLADDLARIPVAWALVGGFAVSARAEPRFTRDVDVCVLADSDAAAEGLGMALTGMGYTVGSIVEHEYRHRLATIRLHSPVAEGGVVDLLFASSGVERETVEGAELLEILPGLTVPVANAGHLVVLKLLARDDGRPQDAMDLRALRSVLTADDETEAHRLAGLVMARGFARERDLPTLLSAYLAPGQAKG
jgi:predicted nucleotidyltransferase